MVQALCLAVMLAVSQWGVIPDVELYDTDRERVVKTVTNTEEFQRAGRNILASATGRVMELNPALEKAMIVKVPLAPPYHLKLASAHIEADIVEMFVVMPKKGKRPPWLILHTTENNSLLLEFSAELNQLKRLLHMK